MPSAGSTNKLDIAWSVSLEARVITDFSRIDRVQWQELDHADNPFLSYAFLAGLEESGSIGPHAGWHPHHLAIFEGDELVAFAPTYAKDNSHGEFVFDWAWADAYQRNGFNYYPKLLTGIPYSPVTGPRLLTRRGCDKPEALKKRLLELALLSCKEQAFSTWHCNFAREDDFALLGDAGLLKRLDWQFHWFNQEYRNFDDFLNGLRSRKRKSIRRERRRVQEAGIQFAWKAGSEIHESELDFIYACYLDTFRNYGNYPALKLSFFKSLAEHLDDRFQAVFALKEGEPVAMAVFLAGGGRLYGRYWGCREDIPALHFETAYYQGIEFCIKNGIAVFESGAQGEHKIGRGFVPMQTRSCHHVEHPLFRDAIEDHLEREKNWTDKYGEQLETRIPFRRDEG